MQQEMQKTGPIIPAGIQYFQQESRHANDHFNRVGQLCGIVNYEKSSPSTFFNEWFLYYAISGYTLFPSQGFHYIDHKSPCNGGHITISISPKIEDFQKDSIAYAEG